MSQNTIINLMAAALIADAPLTHRRIAVIEDWSLLCLYIRSYQRELYERLNRSRGKADDDAVQTAQDLLITSAKLYALVKNERIR